MDMVLQHLILEDATELRKSFQVDNVDNHGPENIIQGHT